MGCCGFSAGSVRGAGEEKKPSGSGLRLAGRWKSGGSRFFDTLRGLLQNGNAIATCTKKRQPTTKTGRKRSVLASSAAGFLCVIFRVGYFATALSGCRIPPGGAGGAAAPPTAIRDRRLYRRGGLLILLAKSIPSSFGRSLVVQSRFLGKASEATSDC